jgi:futalosine hydrolase
MNLLIVAATDAEIAPLSAYFQTARLPDTVTGGVLITGVGMLNATYELTKHLQANRYDLVLQVGVAGTYVNSLKPGDVVFVTSDQYGDLGAEDHDNYLDIFEMGFINPDVSPFINGRLLTPLLPVHNRIKLPQVSGLTVNTVTGSEHTLARRKEKFHCDIETMEGVALHFVCLKERAAFAQVRAISNYVTPRDKSQWQIKEAIINLNNWVIEFINKLAY